jgi:hypothetical protein
MKESYPANVLNKSGAKSAVTGGHPEDMNGMPADINPNDKAPVYDGADLNKPRKIGFWKRLASKLLHH